jgi:ATP-dependent DNA ligase
VGTTSRPPKWIKPQLTRLVDEAPAGDGWLHEIKFDGTGITDKELKRLAGVLEPLQVKRMPLAEPPPRDSRFGSPLKLTKVHGFGRRSLSR